MSRFGLVLFLYLGKALTEECKSIIDSKDLDEQWEYKVHQRIVCQMFSTYVSLPPQPLNGSDAIDAHVTMIVRKFAFKSDEQEFSIFSWTMINWVDERLKWEPSEFGKVDDTLVLSYKLPWIPGVTLSNSISDEYDQRYNDKIPCRISSTGDIFCHYEIHFKAKCVTDVSNWPFDKQVCSLRFGAWTNQRVKVRLSFMPTRAILFIGSEDGAEWDIMDYKQEEDKYANVQLKAYFTLARHAGSLAAMVVYPSLALSVLTVSALFLDARRDTRLLVGSFSLACHFYYLTQLSSVVPVHSTSTPKIMFYFRGSLILTFISFALTFGLKYICKRRAWVPNVIAVANEFVYKSYAKLIIIPRWSPTSNVNDKGEKQAWTDFANVLNTAWIIISLVTYIIIWCECVPLPNGIVSKIRKLKFDFD